MASEGGDAAAAAGGAGAGGEGGEAMKAEWTELYKEYRTLCAAAGAAEVRVPSVEPIGKNDALIVVDMQNDFLPEADAPKGGRFGVADGAHAATVITKLIDHFASAEATVVATRDYHPVDHCSFMTEGGPFPPHCIQGSEGSQFYPPIAEALVAAKKKHDNVHVVFKGFFEDIDSFGAFKYAPEEAPSRLSNRGDAVSCSLSWTGAYRLKQSNIKDDVNAPPDVLSITRKETLVDLLERCSASGEGPARIFVCGLALDFCVMDTARNAKGAGMAAVTVVEDAARAAHIPGFGTHGTGFLTDPKECVAKYKEKGVSLCQSDQILG